MNIVRGVTGLLRRSSNSSNAPSTSESLFEEPRQQVLEDNHWAEIEFNSDRDEELRLGFLWEQFVELSQKSNEQAAAEQALTDFLKFFLRTYESWVPEELMVTNEQNTFLKERCMILGCKSGHPTKVIAGLISELKNVSKTIRELKTATHEELEQVKFEEINDLLHVLEILARAAHNRRIFRAYEGLQMLVRLMKAIVVQMKCTVGFINNEKPEFSSAGRLLIPLQGLLTHIVVTVLHFVESDTTSALTKTCSEQESLEQSSWDTLEDCSTVARKEGTVSLFETGGLNWFVELLRIVRVLREAGLPLNKFLQHATLITMKASLLGNLRAQNHFRSLGGIDALLDAIAPARSNIHSSADLEPRESLLHEWSSEEFRMQATLLEVLREAVYRNLSCLQYLFEKGGVDKFTGALIWSAFIWPKQHEPDNETDADIVEGWNTQVSHLCRILCSFLVPSGDIRGFAMGLSVSQDLVSKVGSYWELAMRWIVKILLGIFRDMESWNLPRSPSTTLQHYTLNVFKKMLPISHTVLNIFRDEGLWEVMFSKYFFYFEVDTSDFSGFGDQGSTYNEENICLCDIGSCDNGIDSEPLRLEVISLVELAATANNNVANEPECSALLKALKYCAGIPSVSTMIVKSLHRILQLVPDQTVYAFKELGALLLLSQVMDIQLQEYLKAQDIDDQSAKAFTLVDSWKLSRKAVFDLFAEYVLTSEEARVVSLHSPKTMQVIFELLWDSTSKKFALAHVLDLMKLAPTSRDDQQAKLELCIKYLESLSRSGFDGKPKDIDVLVDLLSGIREVLETNLLYYQSLFQEAECFVHIVSLLNENLSEDHGRVLCLSVIQTLTLLLSRNNVSKNVFRNLVGPGYTTLQTLLLNTHQGSPTEELLSAILDMLVDGDFNIPGNMVIQNEDAILLFFSMVQKSCKTLQHFGLLTFNRILEESVANKVSCVNAGLLAFLLDWFDCGINSNLTLKLANLIEAIGRHSVSGKDMRKIFSLLRNTNQPSKLGTRKLLLDVVQGMLQEDGPSVFFEMNGKDSGIVITSPLRLPSLKGFSFSCWIRIESMPSTNDACEEKFMGLFTFLTESGKGLNTMIGQKCLVVQSLGQKSQLARLTIDIKPKQWSHLCITHSVGRALTGGNVLKVYVNGSTTASEKLRYSKLNEPLSKSSIGASSHFVIPEGFGVDIMSSSPFCGQLGPIYFFDESLPPDQVAALFKAGSSYMYAFLPTEIGCIPDILSGNSIFDVKEGLASKVIFGLNAQASSHQTIHDITYRTGGTADEANHEARILGGSQLCRRHLLKDILNCIGGVCVFFPLLTQLDQPYSPMNFILEHETLESTGDPHKSNVYVAAEVLELITSVLDNSCFHKQYMHQSKGLSVIGFLLQSISPQHLTTDVASALIHLLAVSSRSSGNSLLVDIVCRKLVEETLKNIFLNLFIWIYTPYMVQRELLITLLNYCETNPSFAPSYISLPRVMDLVQKFYWDKPKNRKIAGSKPILHPVTKEAIGERPNREEVAKLRILLLSLAETAVRKSISMADTKVLLACILKCDDSACLEDVLHMLLRLLGRKDFVATFTENIQVLGGCQLFLGLLERQEETLRLLSLQIIGLLLISVPTEKKGSWLLSIVATGVTRPALDQQRAERVRISALFAAITEKLIAFPFTDMLCATLFDVLLGGASLKQVLQGTTTTGELASQKDSTKSSQIVLPQAVGILMRFLLVCDNLEMCIGVLRDVLRLLEANPLSSEAIVLEPSWQCWFFDLLIQSEETDVHRDMEGDKISKEKESLICDTFTIIHCFCIYRLRGGWRHLERTVNFVHIYAEKGLFPKYKLLHRMYRDLLEALFHARSEDNLPMSQPCRDNTLYMMNLLDELLIEEAIQIKPNLNEELAESSGESLGLPWLNIAMETRTSTSGHDYLINKDSLLMTKEGWQNYDRIWDIIKDLHGKMKENELTGPSLGQRARGLVESINLPAAEMAAAVVAGGLGAVVSMNPSKMIDKAMKLRGDKFPRVVFHLIMLYIYKGDLESASFCVHQFLSVLPLFLSNENEQCKNRLQLFLWCLLEARTQLALQDSGARFQLISQLLRETMDHGRNMLAASMLGKENTSYDTASVQSVLQQDRIMNAVREETFFLSSTISERSNEFKMLNSEMEETEELIKSNLKVLEGQLQSTIASLYVSDMARIAAVQLLDEEDQQAVMNQWCHLFRHLTDERGPWSSISFPEEVKVSWKLDKTEDPWRRRLKLRRNYRFEGQKMNVQGSEVVTPTLAGQGSNLETLLETSKLLLKGLRGISEEVPETREEQPLYEEDEADFEKDIAEALEPVKIEDVASSSTAEQSTIKAEEPFVNEVLHSSVCVLVSPKRKLAGRLNVTADTIYFHGDFLVEGTGGSSVFDSSGQIKHEDHIAIDLVDQRLAGCKEHMNLEVEKSVSPLKWNYVLPAAGPPQPIKGIKRHRRWHLLKVKAVHGTRYLLQYTALEIFFDSSFPPVFFNFPSQKSAKDMGTSIISLRNNLLAVQGSMKEKPENKYFIDKRLALELAEYYKDCWRRREFNNFEYLMRLNTLAGRSYNDLTQYPVFPWVIADYASDTLDLSSSSSFRDLSKPIGALDDKRFEIFEERFQNFSDPDIPSFYYGSHYSSMGIVLFYLLRLEPFTSLHQNFQGGKFDHADRLFHSIDGAFKNCLANTSDVKELIPEFFYMPEFLVNSNKYFMGIKQDGEQLDHVVLPPWAKGSFEEFVLKNREALESEYVSQHLHQWIDLIFGYKQRGGPAVEAANVFYHLTYEGAVDLESIEDRLQRSAVEDQIANFGQTPMQLFRKKHPRRGPAMPIARPLYYAPASITLTLSLSASILRPLSADDEKSKALLFVGVVDSKVVLVTNDLRVMLRNWLTASQAGGNFTFSSSQDPFFAIGAEVSQPYRMKGPFAENLELSTACFQTVEVQGSSYLLTCGFWDNSFRIMSLSDGSLQSYKRHKDVVSCIAVSNDGTTVVTGSHDTTVMIWETDVFLHNSKQLIDKPLHVLSGHDDIVTCVAVSVELDLVVSGSRDSSCMLHTLWEGRYVQSIQHPFRSSISRLVLCKHGLLVFFSADDLLFLLYSINGKHLASSDSNGRINCIKLSSCEEFLVCGGDQGQIVVRSIYTLEVIRRYDGIGSSILSLSVTPEDCFLAGLQNGSLLIYSIERPQQKKSNLLQVLRARST